MTGGRVGESLSLESLGDRYGAMLRSMEICYSKLNPEAKEEAGFHAIVKAIAALDDPKIVEHGAIINALLSEDTSDEHKKIIFESPLSRLLLTVVYLLRAKLASRSSGRTKAWSYMTDAYFWGGITNSSIEHYKQQGSMAQRAFHLRSSEGGSKRDERIEVLRQYVFAQVRKRVLDGGKPWPSIRNAAISIAPLYLTEANRLKMAASQDNAPRLLQEWIRKQPDLSSFIAAKKK